MKLTGKPGTGDPYAGFDEAGTGNGQIPSTAPVLDPTDEGCALQAHEVRQPEMAALVKPSQQPGTESCVVCGNACCEA
jgi:hypothetical protein